jgi:toxin-antitoxin system PIN domain toxin
VILDANLLLYARDTASPFHERARPWLESAMNGPIRVGLPWQTLTAFLRLSTNPRAFSGALSAADAWRFVDGLLDAEAAWVPVPTPGHADVLRGLLVGSDVRGNLVTDAHLAALAIEHGVAVCSADSDFARFPGVRWINPLAAR